MSKKIAEGSDALVLDVKCGDGAFIQDLDGARALARAMVAIGTRAGVRTEAFLTDMDAPLGACIGNAVEIVECLETLRGGGPADLTAIVTRLAARMIVLGGGASDDTAAAARVEDALASGRALATFARLVECHGGDPRIVDDPGRLTLAPDRALFTAPRSGFVTRMRAGSLGSRQPRPGRRPRHRRRAGRPCRRHPRARTPRRRRQGGTAAARTAASPESRPRHGAAAVRRRGRRRRRGSAGAANDHRGDSVTATRTRVADNRVR